jgi:hypothetical protein
MECKYTMLYLLSVSTVPEIILIHFQGNLTELSRGWRHSVCHCMETWSHGDEGLGLILKMAMMLEPPKKAEVYNKPK